MPAITVSQLTNRIKDIFESDRTFRNLTVKGEVSNLTDHTSGHLYFSLKDPFARLSCAMFRGARSTGLDFVLKNGDKIEATGYVSVYPKNGNYQLIISRIKKEGQGDLAAQYLALKEKLQAEGLFAEEHKKEIPVYVHRLGVITSETGDAVRDIIQNARKRYPYIQIELYPATVQGDGAPASLIRGLQVLDRRNLDAIIIGRGGGSMEDLWAFNDENLVRAIYACRTPVISGIGHEPDETLADFAADKRASTPTAAAVCATFDYAVFENRLNTYRSTLFDTLRRLIHHYKQTVLNYKNDLHFRGPVSRLDRMRQQLDGYTDKLQSQMETILTIERKRLMPIEHELLFQMDRVMQRTAGQKELYKQKLFHEMQNRLSREKNRLHVCSERLSGLSPLKRLRDGYGYLLGTDGKRIYSVENIRVNTPIRIYLADGRIDARTETIHRNLFNTEGKNDG